MTTLADTTTSLQGRGALNGTLVLQCPPAPGTLLLHPLSFRRALEVPKFFFSLNAEQLSTLSEGLAPDETKVFGNVSSSQDLLHTHIHKYIYIYIYIIYD